MMKRAAACPLVLVLVLGAAPLFAQSQGKALLYYFQNLTGNPSYNDLAYDIPLCLFGRLGEEERYLIVEPELVREGAERDLWDPEWLQSMATRRRITRVVYGYFHLDDGGLALRCRVYYLKSGLILDLTPGGELYERVREIESMTAAQIRACAREHRQGVKSGKTHAEVLKVQRTPPARIARSGSLSTMSWHTGPVFTTADWLDLYPVGTSALISYTVYPRWEVSRIALGMQTGVLLFSREADHQYSESSLVVLPLGGTVQYVLAGRARDRVVVHGVLGMAFSALSLGGDTVRSLDLYSRAGVGVNLAFGEEHNLYAGVALVSVGYKDAPLNMLTAELGLRFYE
ncbi:MAG: hypothetical protein ACOC8N_02930 [Spirochaetota bacterium]